jgi:hypothetical protein
VQITGDFDLKADIAPASRTSSRATRDDSNEMQRQRTKFARSANILSMQGISALLKEGEPS